MAKKKLFNKVIMKEGGWIIFGQVLGIFGSLIGIRILTSLLNPQDYGELALAMTVSALIVQLIMGPLSNGLTRFYSPAVEANEIYYYVNSYKNLTFKADIIVVLILLVAIIGSVILNKSDLIIIIVISFIFSIINGNNQIINGIQVAARQRNIVAFHQGIAPWMRFLFAATLIYFFKPNSTIALIGYVLGITIVFYSQNLFLRRLILKKITKNYSIDEELINKWSEKIINFAWPFAAWGIFTWAQIVSDRWGLQFFGKTEDVGYYSVLYQLGYYPISIASGMAFQLIAPIFYQVAGDANDSKRNSIVSKRSKHLTIFVLGLTFTIFLLVLFFHTVIFKILVDAQYISVSYLLPWLVLAGGVFSAGQTLTLNLQSLMKTKNMIFAKIGTAIVGICFNLIFAYLWGIKGTVFAINLFSILYLIWIALLNKKYK